MLILCMLRVGMRGKLPNIPFGYGKCDKHASNFGRNVGDVFAELAKYPRKKRNPRHTLSG